MNQQNTSLPTKEELLAALTEQLEVRTLQCKLQECNTNLAELNLREKEALHKLAILQVDIQNDPRLMEDHTITQEDLDKDPELVKMGAKVGQIMKVPRNSKI